MIWKRPKKVIANTAFALSIVSLLMAVFWVYVFYVWNNDPQQILKLDSQIPNYYESKINSYKEEFKTVNTKIKQAKLLEEFLQDFRGMTSLNNDYYLLVDVYNTLIDNYLGTGDYENALNIANSWQQKFPFEFRAKFKYFEVLKQKTPTKALEYIKQINDLYPDINDINRLYVQALIENQKFNNALYTAFNFKKHYINNTNLGFAFYYKDKQFKSYQAKTKEIIPLENIKKINSVFEVNLIKRINNLEGLRFDIDYMKVGSKLKNIKFSIKTQSKVFESIEFKPLNQIKTLHQSHFKSTGNDPYFELQIPKELMKIDETLEIQARLEIDDRPQFEIDEILENKEWKFYYSKTSEFSKEQSIPIRMHLNNDKNKLEFIGESNIETGDYSYLRVDFPWFIGMSPKDWNVVINENIVIDKTLIHHMNNIEVLENNSLRISGNDPYLIFKLPKEIEMSHFKLFMEFENE